MKFSEIWKNRTNNIDGVLANCIDDEDHNFETIFIPINGEKVIVIENGGSEIGIASLHDCDEEYTIVNSIYLTLKPNDNLIDMFYITNWK